MKHHEGTEILGIDYRQGPDLPVLQNGFPDSKFVCFPYESMRTGIYTAGAVRAPMDAALTEEDAGGAVMKAFSASSWQATARQCIRVRAISPTPASSCNAARNANDVPRNARLARSTKMRRARQSSIHTGAAAVESVWAPVRNGLSPSIITR